MITSTTQFPTCRNQDRTVQLPYHEYVYEDDFDGTTTHFLIVDFDVYWSNGRDTGYFAKAQLLPESSESDWQEYEAWLDEQEERHRLAHELTLGNW